MSRLMPALLLLSSCSAGTYEMAADTAARDQAGFPHGIRVDVFPAASPEGEPLLDQTFQLDISQANRAELALSAPIHLEGTVTGYDANPPAAVEVPGSADQPVDAIVQAWVPDSVMGRSVRTDASGAIPPTPAVPGADYVVAWLPQDPQELPMLVLRAQDLTADPTDLSVRLDRGIPLYGIVTDSDGGQLGGATVQLIDPSTGAEGPAVASGQSGSWRLRALPGSWVLRVAGTDRLPIPIQDVPVEVGEDDGIEVDVTYGATSTSTVDGEVLDSGGSPIPGTLVRFRSLSIDDTPGAYLEVKASAGSNGRFSMRIAPGVYDVEYIPPYDGTASPVTLDDPVTVGDGFNEVPAVQLPARAEVVAALLDPAGEPAADVLVRAEELAFDGYVYETTSSADGTFILDVARTDLRWTFTPPSGSGSAVTIMEAPPEQLDEATIHLGEGSPVHLCVTFDSQPLPWTAIDVRDTDGTPLASLLAGEDGCVDTSLERR